MWRRQFRGALWAGVSFALGRLVCRQVCYSFLPRTSGPSPLSLLNLHSIIIIISFDLEGTFWRGAKLLAWKCAWDGLSGAEIWGSEGVWSACSTFRCFSVVFSVFSRDFRASINGIWWFWGACSGVSCTYSHVLGPHNACAHARSHDFAFSGGGQVGTLHLAQKCSRNGIIRSKFR